MVCTAVVVVAVAVVAIVVVELEGGVVPSGRETIDFFDPKISKVEQNMRTKENFQKNWIIWDECNTVIKIDHLEID